MRAAPRARKAQPSIVNVTAEASGAQRRAASTARKAQPSIALVTEADFDAPTARPGPIRGAANPSTTGTARHASSASSRMTRGAR
jgi:hypothetical protein